MTGWYQPCWRMPGRRRSSILWRVAARGVHVNGNHVAEFRYRDQARLIEGLPPLTSKARCLPS